MARRDGAPPPLAIDGDAPPVGTPPRTEGVVSGVALNQPTEEGPTLAVDPDATIPERGRREGALAIRDLDPEPPKRRTSPRFKLPKG